MKIFLFLTPCFRGDAHEQRAVDDDSSPLTFNSETHHIIEARARYPPWPTEYTFKIEVWQAIGDFEDYSGQDPIILNGSSQNYTLNLTGRKILSLMYLADPKTKF